MIYVKRYLNNLKLAKKLALLSTSSLIFLSLTGMGIISYITGQYDQELYESTSNAMAYLISDLESDLKEIETSTDYLIDNRQIQKTLTSYSESTDIQERARSKKAIYDSLYTYFNSSPYIISIVILLPDGAMVRMGYSGQQFGSEVFQELELLSDNANGRLIWQGGEAFQNAAVCSRQIRQKAYLKLQKLATLYVEIDMEQIIAHSLSRSDQSFQNTSLVLRTGKDYFYYPSPLPPDMEMKDLEGITGYDILKHDGNVYFASSGDLPYTNWKYINMCSYNDLFSHIRNAIKTGIIILLVTTLLVILSEFGMISRITYHFHLLEQKMIHFESGSFTLLPVNYDYSVRNDEIGMLHRRFDQTVSNYKKLVENNYLNQLLLKDAAIKNLEQQINPHFLYNVLDSIYLMAEANNVPHIADMSHALADLFRASISEKNPTIPLSHELAYLDSYIRIQLIRFPQQIHFTKTCDAECMDMLIPKLSIQPLVENAIKHGIEETGEECTIVLSVQNTPEGTRICVANTGSAFDEDMEYLLNHPQDSRKDSLAVHGIGLKNINERLHLIYGAQCRLQFTNENNYAIVSFLIPTGGK